MTQPQIPIGVVKRAHGIRGDLLILPLTDHPERFVEGATFRIDRPPHELTVRCVRPHTQGLIVGFEGLGDRTAAEQLAKATLTIPAEERRALADGEYWPDDLVGLRAVAADGTVLGEVTDVVVGEAQDRLVVTTPHGGHVEVPFVAAIVGEPDRGEILMDPPEGLFEEADGG